MKRTQLIAELEAAIAEQKRCMGGVDPAGCVAAARRVGELRNLLRDDSEMFPHFQKVLDAPQPARRRPRRY
jgi:hypothetical protein